MKRISLLFTVAAMMLTAFIGCKKEDNRYHSILIYKPYAGVGYIYADQTLDSVIFSTTESFAFTSDVSWLTLDPSASKGTVKEGYILTTKFAIHLEPNTTGKVRNGVVTGKMYSEDFNQDVGLLYQQLPWHNIVRPIPRELSNMEIEFVGTDSAHWTRDSVKFTAYADWTLEPSADSYLTPRVKSGKAGRHTVELLLTPNATAEKKEATLSLSSNGATTIIKYVQLPKKEK